MFAQKISFLCTRLIGDFQSPETKAKVTFRHTAPRGQDYIAQVVRPVYKVINNNSPERAKEETIIERTQFRPYRTISV